MSLFSSSDTPAVLSDSDTSQVNLGVRFTSSAAGTITGIKYYKSANDTGTHTGSLWSSTGYASGECNLHQWDYQRLADRDVQQSGIDHRRHDLRGELPQQWSLRKHRQLFHHRSCQRPLDRARKQQWCLHYGNGNLFPTSTFNATNYWVDVVFNPSGGGTNQPPVAANDSGFNATQNTPLGIAASALLAHAVVSPSSQRVSHINARAML